MLRNKMKQVRRTYLIYTEGLEDACFLRHLKQIYAHSDCHFSIKPGRGGSADSIVREANKVPGTYTEKIVILDNDKNNTEMKIARTVARQCGISLIEHTPCIEALLLETVFSSKYSPKHIRTDQCKKTFEEKYIPKEKRTDIRQYEKHFPKRLLEERRKKIRALGKLIHIFEKQSLSS